LPFSFASNQTSMMYKTAKNTVAKYHGIFILELTLYTMKM